MTFRFGGALPVLAAWLVTFFPEPLWLRTVRRPIGRASCRADCCQCVNQSVDVGAADRSPGPRGAWSGALVEQSRGDQLDLPAHPFGARVGCEQAQLQPQSQPVEPFGLLVVVPLGLGQPCQKGDGFGGPFRGQVRPRGFVGEDLDPAAGWSYDEVVPLRPENDPTQVPGEPGRVPGGRSGEPTRLTLSMRRSEPHAD